MEHFVIRQNIEHFRMLLERTTDPQERSRILRLLAEMQDDEKQMQERKRAPDGARAPRG